MGDKKGDHLARLDPQNSFNVGLPLVTYIYNHEADVNWTIQPHFVFKWVE